MKTFITMLVLILLYSFIFIVGFYKNEKLQEERNQMYICDAYAYDQENAPNYCFPGRTYDSKCDLDGLAEDDCE